MDGDRLPTEADARIALAAFAFLWGTAELFHLLTFGVWIYEPVGILLFLAAVALVVRPSSLLRLATLTFLDVLYVFIRSPNTANHILFNAMVSATIFTVMVAWWRTGRSQRHVAVLYSQIASILRLELVALYFFAVFHKLNVDYFRADVSCGGELLRELAERFTFVPVNDVTVIASLWTTIIVEAAIPVMLLIPRWRWWGIALGWGFHFVLGLHPHQGLFSFSAMLYALYFLFLPPEFVSQLWRSRLETSGAIARFTERWPQLRQRASMLLGGLGLGCVIAASAVFRAGCRSAITA